MKRLVSLLVAAAMLLVAFSAVAEEISGPLVLYSSMTDNDIDNLIEAFNEVYPNVEVEVVNGSAGELAARIRAEKDNPQGDLQWGGLSPADGDANDDIFAEYLSPYEADLPDAYKSHNGRYNQDHLSTICFCINVELEKELGLNIQSYEDLLDPALKGRIVLSDPNSSSVAKGETLKDTIKMVSGYADVVVMRTPWEGSAKAASLYSAVPVVNAGDGGHNHPTQTLTDLLTIKREKGRFDNMTIGFCGDLKFGRTVHSLIEALSRSTGVKFVLISPEELKLPSYIKKDVLQAKGLQYSQETDLAAVMPELDILYMTRVQRERFFNEEDYLRLKDSYILTPEKLAGAKKDLRILHPLPRVNEISTAIDDDPRACYFRQALCGKYVRMALILKLLEA